MHFQKGLLQMEEQKEKKQGHKGKGQKYKSLLVWDILQKRTDENHAIQLKDIVYHLKMYGITAERHSIKRDIDDILILLNKELDIDLDEHGVEEPVSWIRSSSFGHPGRGVPTI